MPTETTAILDLGKQISALAQSFQDGAFLDKELQNSLAVAAEKLVIATREPQDNVYHIGTQIAQNAALRSVIAIGVFDVMPLDGTPISCFQLASQLKVNESLLGRLMRACVSTHIFKNPSPQQYAHNAFSLAYTDPSSRAMMSQMYDFTSKGVFALPDFIAGNKFQSTGSYSSGPFQLGANTSLGFWEYLSDVPERMELFSAGMRARTTIGSGRASGVYPFGEALNTNPCSNNEIAIVDVGGGRGQALEAIREDWPKIRGRFVLQDLPHVIEDGKTKGHPSFLETSKASFFEPQRIIGARIYYFRRIFHDWDQERSREILVNTKGAMTDLSRIVIADMVLPDVDAPWDMALQDLNMMSFGGMERSEAQWRELIQSAGLLLKKVWLGTDGARHAVVEAVLPTFRG